MKQKQLDIKKRIQDLVFFAGHIFRTHGLEEVIKTHQGIYTPKYFQYYYSVPSKHTRKPKEFESKMSCEPKFGSQRPKSMWKRKELN